VLACLVRQGILQINLPGQQIAEGETDSLARLGLDTLSRFTSLGKPKALPEQALRELLIGLEIDPALISDPRALESIVSQIQQKVIAELDQTVRLLDSLRIGPRFWREPIYSAAELQTMRTKLEGYRQFLDNLQRLNNPARLRNLSQGVGELRAAFKARQHIIDLNEVYDLLRQLQPVLDYLYQAEALLPAGHPWLGQATDARLEILKALSDPDQRKSPGAIRRWIGRLENLQSAYAQVYFDLHQKNRLDRSADDRKRRLTADPRWARLRALSRLELLSERQLQQVQDAMGNVKSCPALQMTDLRNHAACPHCGFSPASETSDHPALQRLEELENQFEQLYTQWVTALLSNLETPDAQRNLQMLGERENQAVAQFIQTKTLPDKITDIFLDGLNDTLQGLEKVVIDANEMLLALTRPGMPCTLDAFEARIRDFLSEQVKNKNRSKIRIQVEW